MQTKIDDQALSHLASVCEGDARKALNALEIAVMTTQPSEDGMIRVTRSEAEESIQKKAVLYDKDEDEHYDTISAFIKSVRGSDPDAAIYWLAKMLVAGEDPRFVARRLIILASEDVGNADPQGLILATSALQAVEFIGMPEAQLTLSQVTTYLATAPKSNSATLAIGKAMKDINSGKVLPVPKHLRDGHYAGAKKLGHTGYQYAHDGEHHFVDQEYAPTDKQYYKPGKLGYEKTIQQRLDFWDKLRKHPRRDENKT
jgi:putative ATPase